MDNKIVTEEINELKTKIFSTDENLFDNLALKIFELQYRANPVYRQYSNLLGKNPLNVKNTHEIPFLPIEFFKTNQVCTGKFEPEQVFSSSATTGAVQSKHFVADLNIYKESFINSFTLFIGNPPEYCFLALLPGYLEREGSSLIYMVNELMKISKHPENGFFLYDHQQLKDRISRLEKQKQKFVLFGVSFALLDFASTFTGEIKHGIVMETGGMKGKRKEMSKPELQSVLKSAFKTNKICSEYGMTELLSQAYSTNDNIFKSPPWMKILVRDTYDPYYYLKEGLTGGINVIDLANLYSCSFIETKDLGKLLKNGQFEILGRFDNSEIRGCNLMVE
ncbi:MAG: acyltransferase [Bacteroidales bacterium]